MKRFRSLVVLFCIFSMCSPLGAQSQIGPPGLIQIAAKYETGDGQTKQDMGTAIRFYKDAARKGHTPSMVRLGYLYQVGLGVKQDLPAAFMQFSKAARAGNPVGQFLLAVSYEQGTGTSKDLVKARYWFLQSAAAGIQFAQYRLGLMLLYGKGGNRKKAGARRWLRRAALGKDRVVAESADEIRRKIDKDLFSPDNSGTALVAAAALLFVVGTVAGGGGTGGSAESIGNPGMGVMPSSRQRICSPVPVSSSGMIVNDSALSRPGSFAAVQMVCQY